MHGTFPMGNVLINPNEATATIVREASLLMPDSWNNSLQANRKGSKARR